ncbi:MAG: hypothetical protein O3C67_11330 [Cyanobacteria bacterium]|nr:hypothetical protein [Cyanobacteriota bacterium]
MFIATQGYEWISHQTWFGAPQIALPWLILGGIGLAIASNRSELKALTTAIAPPQLPLTSTPTPSVSPAPSGSVAPTMPAPAAGLESPQPRPQPHPQPRPQPGPQGKSISFEINP